MGVLRSAGLRFHECFTWNRPLARIYGAAWTRVMALLPESTLKAHLRNNLIDANWPDDSLAPYRLELCEGLEALLRARVGNLALRKGLFRQRLAHEPEVFDFLRKRHDRYDAVVEVGANIGVYTLLFAKRLVPQDGTTRVFSYEPSRRAYADLLEHLRLNDVANVVAFNSAVGPGPSPSPFHENDRDLMKGTLDAEIAPMFEGGAVRTTMALVTGCDEIQQLTRDFGRILLKIDVIGSEPAVVHELKAFIEQSAPEIVLGVWEENLEGLQRADWLRSRYRLFRIGAGQLSPRDGFSDPSYCNYFLEPR